MSNLLNALLLSTIAFFTTANAQTTLYDNTDLPVPLGQRLTHPDEAWLLAQPFRTGDASTTITSVALPFARIGNPTGEIRLSIWDEDGGLPSQLVGELGSIDDIGALSEFAPSDSTLGSVLTFSGPISGLEPNSTYFVHLDLTDVDSTSFTSAAFPLNNIVNGAPTIAAGTNAAGSLLGTDRSTTNWFDVSERTGNPMYLQMSVEAVAVPEPSSMILLLVGLVGVVRSRGLTSE